MEDQKMKKCLPLLLSFVMLFSAAAFAESAENTEKPEETAAAESTAKTSAVVSTEMTAESNPMVDLVFQEGMALLQDGKYQEAYDDLLAAADAGSSDAMEALARGVILDKTLTEAAYGDDEHLLALSREFADKGDPWGMWTAAFLCMNGMGTGIRYEEAYRLFERAADADNEEVRGLALYELGYMLANGYYERDSGKALECYRAAADLGNAYAMGNLGLSYAKGTLTEQNHDAALSWFAKALQTKDKNAKIWVISRVNQIGNDLLFPSNGSEPDYETAKAYYTLSADQEDPDGLFYIGVMHGQGWGCDRSSVKAITYFSRALDQGSAPAAYNLAVLYTYGDKEIRQDLDKGFDYFCQAADLGYAGTADLMNDTAVKILNGDGFPKDPLLALAWYEKAADAGSTYACNNLAYLCAYHPVKEIEQDLQQALTYYKKAAELGDDKAPANLYTTAMNLLEGKQGLKRDPQAAMLWFKEAAYRGNVPSMVMLGRLYSDKVYQKDFAPDMGTALRWFEKAADAGDYESMKKLGELYIIPESGYTNYEKALRRCSEAADLCDPENAKELALLAARINNIGVACSDFESEYYNPNLAFGAYNKAFELGDNSALINLAKAYATGLGTNVKSIMANNLLDAANYTGNRDNFFADNTWIKAKA